MHLKNFQIPIFSNFQIQNLKTIFTCNNSLTPYCGWKDMNHQNLKVIFLLLIFDNSIVSFYSVSCHMQKRKLH